MDNADLLDLGIKQKLIGSTFYYIENDVEISKIIIDFEFNCAIDQVCLEFNDNTTAWINFRDKFKISTVDIVPRVRRGRGKRHKKK